MASLDFARVGLQVPSGLRELRAASSPSLHRPQQFLASQVLRLDKSTVLRGTIQTLDPTSNDPAEIEVVCKYKEEDTFPLGCEASIYKGELHELQGIVVPTFYELFEGSYTDGVGKENHVACIILEYCSSDRSWDLLWDGPLQTRADIALAMLQVHGAGVMQGDFEDANVLVSENGEACIVDFDQASHHDCQGSTYLKVWEYEPPRYDFGCDEMFHVIRTLELWTPVHVSFYGGHIHIFDFLEPESLAEWYLPKVPSSKEPETKVAVRRRAEEALAEYYERFEERFQHIGHPKDVRRQYDGRRAQRAAEDSESSDAADSSV